MPKNVVHIECCSLTLPAYAVADCCLVGHYFIDLMLMDTAVHIFSFFKLDYLKIVQTLGLYSASLK